MSSSYALCVPDKMSHVWCCDCVKDEKMGTYAHLIMNVDSGPAGSV